MLKFGLTTWWLVQIFMLSVVLFHSIKYDSWLAKFDWKNIFGIPVVVGIINVFVYWLYIIAWRV